MIELFKIVKEYGTASFNYGIGLIGSDELIKTQKKCLESLQKFLDGYKKDVAQECYLECLALECSECARAIKTLSKQ